MQLRVVIFGHDARGAKNLHLSVGTVAACGALVVVALSCVLWLGWKIGELTAAL